ncbi:MAG TPA: MFS transporter [Myxococcales bacterium]|jgi:OPA family glycerol-3-phosphate transporter-like MFS transporter
MTSLLAQLAPLALLVAVIALVVWRLPKVELGHSAAFKRRRLLNWFPLGLTYAFLYFGRYNLNEATSVIPGLTNADFGVIFGAGTATYGLSFLVNGPLTDKWGGRFTILLSAAGAALANVATGLLVWAATTRGFVPPGGMVVAIAALYSLDMYFQSFGAVSIVKVNAHWFHVRERGVLSGVFGILISLGLYFAYDWSAWIVKALPVWWVFFIPAMSLAVFWVVEFLLVRDTPSQAGYADFDTADASSGDTGPALGVAQVFRKMLASRAILFLLGIEFCSGFMSNAIMQWGRKFARQTDLHVFVFDNWGLVMCVAGILGGMFAGVLSDRVFGSRRGPVSAVLYGGMVVGAAAAAFVLERGALIGWTVAFMSVCVIGVHGMLSGTATMDFGGKRNAGIAVAIVDGAVYLGVATQSFLLGALLPSGEAAKVVANWRLWPLGLLPLSVVGFVLATRVWHATPGSQGGAARASPGAPPPVAGAPKADAAG